MTLSCGSLYANIGIEYLSFILIGFLGLIYTVWLFYGLFQCVQFLHGVRDKDRELINKVV